MSPVCAGDLTEQECQLGPQAAAVETLLTQGAIFGPLTTCHRSFATMTTTAFFLTLSSANVRCDWAPRKLPGCSVVAMQNVVTGVLLVLGGRAGATQRLDARDTQTADARGRQTRPTRLACDSGRHSGSAGRVAAGSAPSATMTSTIRAIIL
jgi:hypothetical protein